MKVCETCGDEIGTRDGENNCERCERDAKRAKANKRRRERAAVMRDLGMVRVRGALGGVYWE